MKEKDIDRVQSIIIYYVPHPIKFRTAIGIKDIEKKCTYVLTIKTPEITPFRISNDVKKHLDSLKFIGNIDMDELNVRAKITFYNEKSKPICVIYIGGDDLTYYDGKRYEASKELLKLLLNTFEKN